MIMPKDNDVLMWGRERDALTVVPNGQNPSRIFAMDAYMVMLSK